MKRPAIASGLLIMLLAPLPASLADHITRRGSEPGLDGTITLITDNGVNIRSNTGAEHKVTWDRIREVQTQDPNLQQAVAEFHDVAQTLWRARSRLERGDMAMAEPLFDRLFAQFRGATNETALIVAEGVLRCRLARAADDTAVIPALEVARLRNKKISTTAYRNLPALFDEATALCVQLPPAWVPTAALARTEVELKSYDAGGDTAVAALAALYRAAARQQLGLPPDATDELAGDHPGVSLMKLLVRARADDAEQRAASRTALNKRLADLPAWAQAWAYHAIGMSLLRESGVGRQQAGLVSLASLPASYLREQPYLTAISLATMVSCLQEMGEADAAATLRNELVRQFPNHPALSLLDATVAPVASSDASVAGKPKPQLLPFTLLDVAVKELA